MAGDPRWCRACSQDGVLKLQGQARPGKWQPQLVTCGVCLACPLQVLGAVPPARLATAMLSSAAGGPTAGIALSAAAAARDAADEALVSRLEWLRGWTEQVAEKDADDSCRQEGWVGGWAVVAPLPSDIRVRMHAPQCSRKSFLWTVRSIV